MSFSCSECSRKFSLKSNLTRHRRVVHNVAIPRSDILPAGFDVYHFKCLEGCNVSFRYNRDLRLHLKSEHNMDLMALVLEFPNMDEFEKWMHEEEAENSVQYVHLTATKKRSTGTETDYYECSRTGKRTPLQENSRKRKSHKQGTAKVNRGCTSQIIVNKNCDDSLSVSYYKTHYGHDIGLEHLRLSKQDRGAIASKLLIGMSSSRVLNSFTRSTDQGHLKRINLLRRKDIMNIKRSMNIQNRDGKLINIDTINVENFISECSQMEYNPILFNNTNFYQSDGPTCLVIMSKTQAEMLCCEDNVLIVQSTCLNKCDFELVILYVYHQNSHRSFPAACMFTSKVDPAICEIFFTKILERFDEKITCQTLITNCNDMFFEAWKKVSEQTPEFYYNPSQIKFDWKLNLNRISCDEADVTKVKREWVYETLQILQNAALEDEFQENLEDTLRMLEKDPDFKDFVQYFLKHFSCSERWAGFNRNDYLTVDAIEKSSSDLARYLDQDDDRFDKAFHNVIRYIRDMTIDYIVEVGADCDSYFAPENDRRHQTACDKQFEVAHVRQRCWNIVVADKTYVVHRHLMINCCTLVCSTCSICVHSFSCSCIDFFVNSVICEHIHYIYMTNLQGEATVSETSEEIIIEVYEQKDDNVEEGPAVSDVEMLQSEVLERSAELAKNISDCQDENMLKVVLETINGLCSLTELKNNKSESGQTMIPDHAYL